MLIIETSVFTRQVQALLQDDEYRELQINLVLYPDAGALIPGGGGHGRCVGRFKVAESTVGYV